MLGAGVQRRQVGYALLRVFVTGFCTESFLSGHFSPTGAWKHLMAAVSRDSCLESQSKQQPFKAPRSEGTQAGSHPAFLMMPPSGLLSVSTLS